MFNVHNSCLFLPLKFFFVFVVECYTDQMFQNCGFARCMFNSLANNYYFNFAIQLLALISLIILILLLRLLGPASYAGYVEERKL